MTIWGRLFFKCSRGPHAISKNNKVNLQEGMVVSNEPGYYEKNKFGIRIENLIYVKKVRGKKYFENLTMAPIDKELIKRDMLSDNEKNGLMNIIKRFTKILKKQWIKQKL